VLTFQVQVQVDVLLRCRGFDRSVVACWKKSARNGTIDTEEDLSIPMEDIFRALRSLTGSWTLNVKTKRNEWYMHRAAYRCGVKPAQFAGYSRFDINIYMIDSSCSLSRRKFTNMAEAIVRRRGSHCVSRQLKTVVRKFIHPAVFGTEMGPWALSIHSTQHRNRSGQDPASQSDTVHFATGINDGDIQATEARSSDCQGQVQRSRLSVRRLGRFDFPSIP